MSQEILNKKIPSLLGLAIIAVGLTATTFLVKNTQVFESNANSNDIPKSIQTSNITPNSFTITFLTDSPSIGSISLGENVNNLEQKFLDKRDITTNSVNTYNTHYIEATNLTPNKKYYYQIHSGDKTILNGDKPFEIKTAPLLNNNSSNPKFISGKVILNKNVINNDGIVLIKIIGAQDLSGLIDKNGNYNISLNNLRTKDLTNNYLLKDDSEINIYLNAGIEKSNIFLKGNQISSIPAITLSNNYDFSENSKTLILKDRDVKFPEFKSNSNIKQLNKVTTTKYLTPTFTPSVSTTP